MSNVLRKRNVRYRSPNRDQRTYVNTNRARASFTALDILRVLAGILTLNLVLSYYITGTPLWGTETRLTNPRYLEFLYKHHWVDGGVYPVLSESELSQYNGINETLPVYVAVNGKVYDVTSNRETYGPLGAYSFFSGRDAARAYVTGCFQTDLTHDLRGLDEAKAKRDLQGWQKFYEKNTKYWMVAYVKHKPPKGDPPPPCKGNPAPSGVGV